MGTENERYAIWLVPAERERKIFASLIANLAARFEAPIFEPHITLFGGIGNREQALRAFDSVVRREMGASYQPMIEGVHCGATFTKTLFVRFVLSAELLHLHRVVAEELGELDGNFADTFDPHLSLLYRQMEPDEKQALAREIQLPWSRVAFTELILIAHPPEIRTRADVEAWRVLGERRLTSTT